jgi:SAM-dependent methyltransferase
MTRAGVGGANGPEEKVYALLRFFATVMPDKGLVKAGYEAIASKYLDCRTADRVAESEDVRLLEELVALMPRGALVLDAGCGAGVPIAQVLARSFRVVGLDFARAQIRLARTTVPIADLIVGDLVHLPFREDSFDGVCSYYAIIHVPREEHLVLVQDVLRVLKPSGLALLCMGESDLPHDEADYMGTRMFWSHFDAETNERILQENGFEILLTKSIRDFSDPTSFHRFFLARKQQTQDPSCGSGHLQPPTRSLPSCRK